MNDDFILKEDILLYLKSITRSFVGRLPEEPIGRIIREGDNNKKCHLCGSSLQVKYFFFRSIRCIQPRCYNFHERRRAKK